MLWSILSRPAPSSSWPWNPGETRLQSFARDNVRSSSESHRGRWLSGSGRGSRATSGSCVLAVGDCVDAIRVSISVSVRIRSLLLGMVWMQIPIFPRRSIPKFTASSELEALLPASCGVRSRIGVGVGIGLGDPPEDATYRHIHPCVDSYHILVAQMSMNFRET